MADEGELKAGEVRAVTAGGKSLVLTQQEGNLAALDGKCPHQGGPLAEGTLEDGVLRCPWHGWGFCSKTGESTEESHGGVAAYDVEVRDGGIHVAVESPPKPGTISDVMVETMVNWGVTHVFGMVGHSNLGLAEAIRQQEIKGNLTFIGIRHEGAASFACSAFGKLTGRPAACLAIAGPGATNLLFRRSHWHRPSEAHCSGGLRPSRLSEVPFGDCANLGGDWDYRQGIIESPTYARCQ